jgi:hypothetical protein
VNKKAVPVLAIGADRILYPTQLDNLVGVRLGILCPIEYDAGINGQWSIVVRRDGDRLCQIDYDDELVCEEELRQIRKGIDDWLTGGVPFEMPTKALSITNFNPANGQEL